MQPLALQQLAPPPTPARKSADIDADAAGGSAHRLGRSTFSRLGGYDDLLRVFGSPPELP
jgi:hypothetical protein